MMQRVLAASVALQPGLAGLPLRVRLLPPILHGVFRLRDHLRRPPLARLFHP